MSQLGQLHPGSKCDRYEIVRLIGSGGMGEVYQALHEFTKKPVALKVLKVLHAAKENLVEKMRAEAMVLCRIRHDNLVEVYDAGLADVPGAAGEPVKVIWMAMELLDGESLRERLMREGALRPELALEWASQVADGLGEAHEAQVIHRDLKPENIFITKKGEVTVLDFGTAKFEGMGMPKTAHQERMGTVPYMSPEHLADGDVDGRSDVYSLGIILYEMLAGRHPFANQDGSFPPLQQMIPMMLAGDPASLAPFIGEPIWQIVHRAIQSNRAYRFSSMREMAQTMRSVRAQITGSDQRGPIRLSGGSSGDYPPTAPLPTPATPPTGTNFANATPPPLAGASPPAVGITGGALAAMAVVAALLGAVVVVLVMRGGSASSEDEETTDQPVDVRPANEPKEEEPKEEAPKSQATSDPAPTASATAATPPPPSVPGRPASLVPRPTPKATPQPPPPPPAPDKEPF